MVACVVVNWNGWQDTVACLRTLAVQTVAGQLHVLVVDNGSTNDSVDQIEACLRELNGSDARFQLIAHPSNIGFSSGSNLGIRAALATGPTFVWLLNNDTECPPDTLEKLLATACNRPDAGIIGTVLYYYDDPSKVQAWSGGKVNPWLGTSTHYYQPASQDRHSYTTFASALIRAEVFREIGLLYEGFFMYYDDTDLCLRMEKTRWKIAVAADTAVLHKEGASTDGVRNPFMEKTIAVSGLRFLKRHSPAPPLSQAAFVLLKLANRISHGEWAAARAILRAVGEYHKEPVPER